MNGRMNRKLEYLLIITILVVVAVLAAFWASSTYWFPRYPWRPWEPRPPPSESIIGDIELFYTVETMISTVNVTLSVFLLLIYIGIYRKTRSEFTIGLIIFSMVFLLNALASNPFIVRVFGYMPLGLGPFAMLPDVFTLGALAVLLYLSIRY